MTKNNNSKKTFWDYWSTSHLVFGALAALITAVSGLFALGIFKAPNFSQQNESPIVKNPKNSQQPQTYKTPIVETPENSDQTQTNETPIVKTPKNSDQTQTNETRLTSDITKPIPTPEKKEEDTVLPQESLPSAGFVCGSLRL